MDSPYDFSGMNLVKERDLAVVVGTSVVRRGDVV
jgi:hypothetical protein